MQDRVALYPGRWTITPVTGQTNVYDLVRADQPTQAGTPLNKATFLSDSAVSAVSDATGGAFSSDPLVSEAILNLASMVGADRGTVEHGSYVGTGTYGTSHPTTITFSSGFVPKFMIVVGADADAGMALLVNILAAQELKGIGTQWAGTRTYPNPLFSEAWTNVVSFISEDGALQQMNSSSVGYEYWGFE